VLLSWPGGETEPQSIVLIVRCSSRSHVVATCSPTRLAGDELPLTKSARAEKSTGPFTRNARANARLRTAACRQSGRGCSDAPRPGSLPAGSGINAPATATTRSNSTLAARSRHPTHVRTGVVDEPLVTGQCTAPDGFSPPASSDPASLTEVASPPSPRMSMRQPVNRAASRAFCPSRPMASESW
jgi:hypothetical protein